MTATIPVKLKINTEDKVHLALRRCKTEGKTYNVADLLNKVCELLGLDVFLHNSEICAIHHPRNN